MASSSFMESILVRLAGAGGLLGRYANAEAHSFRQWQSAIGTSNPPFPPPPSFFFFLPIDTVARWRRRADVRACVEQANRRGDELCA